MTLKDWVSANCKFMKAANFWDGWLQKENRVRPQAGARNDIEKGFIETMASVGIMDIKVYETHPNFATTVVFEGTVGIADPYVVKISVELEYTFQNSKIEKEKTDWHVVITWELFKDDKPLGVGPNVTEEFRPYDWKELNRALGPFNAPTAPIGPFEFPVLKSYLDKALLRIKEDVANIRKTDGQPFAKDLKRLNEPERNPQDISDAEMEFENQNGDQ